MPESCIQVLMDGSDGQTDLRMSMPQNAGAFYRESTKPDGSALCLGRVSQAIINVYWRGHVVMHRLRALLSV